MISTYQENYEKHNCNEKVFNQCYNANFWTMPTFYTTWKHEKARGSLLLFGGEGRGGRGEISGVKLVKAEAAICLE